MMLISTNRVQAEKYWKKCTVQRISKEQERDGNYGQEDKRRDSKQSIDKNKQEVTKMCNQYRLVPKSNKDYRLVVDLRGVNKFMKPIHFKMEGIPTLE
jgi:hypothetical protein